MLRLWPKAENTRSFEGSRPQFMSMRSKVSGEHVLKKKSRLHGIKLFFMVYLSMQIGMRDLTLQRACNDLSHTED